MTGRITTVWSIVNQFNELASARLPVVSRQQVQVLLDQLDKGPPEAEDVLRRLLILAFRAGKNLGEGYGGQTVAGPGAPDMAPLERIRGTLYSQRHRMTPETESLLQGFLKRLSPENTESFIRALDTAEEEGREERVPDPGYVEARGWVLDLAETIRLSLSRDERTMLEDLAIRAFARGRGSGKHPARSPG